MLFLVHPAPGGQGTDPPARRKGSRSPAFSLTADEARHVRAALRNTARAYGGLACLAAVMGLDERALQSFSGPRGRRPSGTFAIRLARAAGITVEAVLSGAVSDAGRCKACGSRIASGRVAAGGAR